MAGRVDLPVVDLASSDVRAAAAAVRKVSLPDYQTSREGPCFAGAATSTTRVICSSFFLCQACVEHGFFYVSNHGVEDALLEAVFAESRRFFEQPMEGKMALQRGSNHRGYTPPYAEKLDAASEFTGWVSDQATSFSVVPFTLPECWIQVAILN